MTIKTDYPPLPFHVTHPIPAIPVPLAYDTDEPILAIGVLLEQIYKQARYDLRINYTQEPTPSFGEQNSQWLAATLREVWLRV